MLDLAKLNIESYVTGPEGREKIFLVEDKEIMQLLLDRGHLEQSLSSPKAVWLVTPLLAETYNVQFATFSRYVRIGALVSGERTATCNTWYLSPEGVEYAERLLSTEDEEGAPAEEPKEKPVETQASKESSGPIDWRKTTFDVYALGSRKTTQKIMLTFDDLEAATAFLQDAGVEPERVQRFILLTRGMPTALRKVKVPKARVLQNCFYCQEEIAETGKTQVKRLWQKTCTRKECKTHRTLDVLAFKKEHGRAPTNQDA